METLARAANRGSVSTGYDIDNSLKFEEDNSEYLQRATGGGNGSQSQHTISVWVKRTELTKTSFILGFANIGRLRFESDDKIEYQFRSGRKIETNRKFRDTSAWYHIVVVADSTLATSTDRMKLYINGVRETDLLTYIPQDQNQGSPAWGVYNTYNYRIGYSGNAGENFNGYIADAYYINGQTLDPTDFGEFDDTGIWKPKEFTGTFGSLDNYLDFSNSSNLGEDANGGTDLSANNITSADQATDTPTNNFAIPNVIGTTRTNAFTYTEGGTKIIHNGGSDWNSWANTMAVGSGKWYAEFKIIGGNSHFVGVGSEDYYFVGAGSGTGFPEVYYGYSGTNSVGYHNTNGDIYNNGTQVVIGTTYTTNDIISVALDMDNGKVYFAKNGTYINSQNPVTGTNSISLPDTSARYFIGTSHYTSSIGAECNYGGYTSFSIASAAGDSNNYGAFEFAPPSGYYALCTKNLAEEG